MTVRILKTAILCLGMILACTQAQAAVVVSSVAQLEAAVINANAGGDKTILVADGTYHLNDPLNISGDNITIRGQSGNRGAVVIRGQGMDGDVSHVFQVYGSHFTARNMTIGRVANHAIQVHGEFGASHATIANLRIVDTYEQMIKVSYNSSSPNSSTNGLVENCLFEYTAGIGPQFYIGGVDAHQARDWIIRNNVFRNIASPDPNPDRLAEHAIHFWSGSQDTLVEGNQIIDCDRGIGFGMDERTHVRGVIRNNMIYHSTRNSSNADVGIDLQSSSDTRVYNNTIFFRHGYPNAIEYRFAATTGAFIANNLTNKAIVSRDGAVGTLTHNVTSAQAGWFVDPDSGDLHLASAVPSVVNRGTAAIPGLPSPFLDYDGQRRPMGSGIDIGADEYELDATPFNPAIPALLLD